MNVNKAIKMIKAETNKVNEENKKFDNKDVKNHLKQVNEWIKETIKMRDIMLDLSVSYDYRTSMITNVNFCFEWIGECYFLMLMKCGCIEDYEEYNKTREFYKEEEERVKSLKI